MSDQLAYEAVLAEVQAMADGAAGMPKMPVDAFIHKALRFVCGPKPLRRLG